jgi:hypothetical protein
MATAAVMESKERVKEVHIEGLVRGSSSRRCPGLLPTSDVVRFVLVTA